MENVKLSIVIPIYNIASYIERCVLSIIRQVSIKDDIEILLIDDGSTDDSNVICDRLAKEFNHIIVLHKYNGGLSDARNYGLKRVTGDYVWFVDGDDYVADDALCEISKVLYQTKPDIINIAYEKIFSDGKIEPYIPIIDKPNLLHRGIEMLAILGAIPTWTNIFNRNFLLKYNLFFVKNLVHEDFEFGIRSYALAQTVVFLRTPLYKYMCQRPGSIMNTVSSRSPIGYASNASSIHQFISDHNFTIEEKDIIMRTVAKGVIFSFERLSLTNSAEFKKVIRYYKGNKRNIADALMQYTFFYKLIGLIFRISPFIAYKLFTMTRRFMNICYGREAVV